MLTTKPKQQIPLSIRTKFFIIICLFLLASVPRLLSLDAHWSSDEARWLKRSADFMSAIKTGAFSETLLAYHPGVTTMWVAGLRTFFVEPSIDVPNLAQARLFIDIILWASMGIASFLLYQLFGRWIAFASFACLAYSPFFLAQARRIHTDALASIFIVLTVLLFLVYCQNRHRPRYLILSGITFGLAVLSKSYALILLPWIPLCLFLFREEQAVGKSINFLIYIAEGLCFFNCTALTILIIWPVLWMPIFGILGVCLLGTVITITAELKKKTFTLKRLSFWAACVVLITFCIRLLQTVWIVFDKVNWAVTTPHEVEHFFLGKVVNDPGWLFYLLVLTIKSTPLMLPLALLACILTWKQRKQTEKTGHQFRMVLALSISVVLFMVCLSVTSKKFSRYLLPAFPMLEILAAIGFIEGLKWSYAVIRSRFGRAALTYKVPLAVIACLCFLFFQVMPVLVLHPYYGTYYNLCWKVTNITKIITVGEASGMDIAAKYLMNKKMDRPMRGQVSPLSLQFFAGYFIGFVRPTGLTGGPPADYEVVYIRDSQIGRVPQTGTLNGELEAVITLNGIDHVWIYKVK